MFLCILKGEMNVSPIIYEHFMNYLTSTANGKICLLITVIKFETNNNKDIYFYYTETTNFRIKIKKTLSLVV